MKIGRPSLSIRNTPADHEIMVFPVAIDPVQRLAH